MAIDLEKLKKLLDSEEFKKDMELLALREKRKEEVENRYIEKFHSLRLTSRWNIIEKIRTKYDSDEYVRREYRMGYEPRTPLYFLLLEYARKYGMTILDEYGEDLAFCAELFLVDGYYVELMIGQGSVVHVMDKKAFLEMLERNEECKKKYANC